MQEPELVGINTVNSNLPTEPNPTPSTTTMPVRFSGSGSEYFRIWIVNLLLTLVTFGLYHPWARVRKLRYFYSNTLVGDDALGYHAEPRRMFKGYLLVGAVVLLANLSQNFLPILSAVLVLAIYACAPFLIWSALRFRLANTSLRGIRFQFLGTAGGIYKIGLRPLLFLLGGGAVLWALTQASLGNLIFIPMVVFFLGWFYFMGWTIWTFKNYQHSNYAWGSEKTQWQVGLMDLLSVYFKTALMGAAVGIPVAILFLQFAGSSIKQNDFQAIVTSIMIALPVYWILCNVLFSYLQSRLQNVVWGGTRSEHVRFESHLSASAMVILNLKNTVLTLLSLGLYWPFAAVAMARLRLQALQIHVSMAPHELFAAARQDPTTLGDIAGDVTGIDVGY